MCVMYKPRQVLAALKRGGGVETRPGGSYRYLQRVMRRRTALQSASNEHRLNAYSAHLGQLFKGWLSSVDTAGYSSARLLTQLDEAATQWFPRAFANGRNLAYPRSYPPSAAHDALAAKILSNRQFLRLSLSPDMDACFASWRRLNGDRPTTLSVVLRASFLGRVGMGGGAIWAVTEAGYEAGVHQARADLAVRMTGCLPAAEGDDEEAIPQPGDDALATALGLTEVGLLQLIGHGRRQAGIKATRLGTGDRRTPGTGALEAAGVRVGIAYEAEGDNDTCQPCSVKAHGGSDRNGIYWSENECPLPGEDCAAGRRCRCVLATVTEIGEAPLSRPRSIVLTALTRPSS